MFSQITYVMQSAFFSKVTFPQPHLPLLLPIVRHTELLNQTKWINFRRFTALWQNVLQDQRSQDNHIRVILRELTAPPSQLPAGQNGSSDLMGTWRRRRRRNPPGSLTSRDSSVAARDQRAPWAQHVPVLGSGSAAEGPLNGNNIALR